MTCPEAILGKLSTRLGVLEAKRANRHGLHTSGHWMRWHNCGLAYLEATIKLV